MRNRRSIVSLGEDVNIDITVDGSTETDAISEAIETKEASEQLTEQMNQLTYQLEALDTIESIKDHLLKFKITKENMHLLNLNGSLNQQLGIFVPAFEEDMETGEVTEPTDKEIEDANTNIEITIESLDEKYQKVKANVIKIIDSLIAAFKEFYAKMTDKALRLRKSIGSMAHDVKAKASEKMESLKKQTAKIMKFSAMENAMDKINAAIDKCRWLRGEGEVTDSDIENDPYVSAALAAIGYKIENGHLVEDEPEILAAEEGTLEERGWTKAFTDKTFKVFDSVLGKVPNMAKGANLLEKIKAMFTKKPDTDQDVVKKGKLSTQISELFARKTEQMANVFNGVCAKVRGSKEEGAAA